MKIPVSLIWALECYRSSFVEVNCSGLPASDIAEEFSEIFRGKWTEAYTALVEELSEDDGQFPDGYFPQTEEESCQFSISVEENRFVVRLEPLYIQYCYGDFCEVSGACEALDAALAELVEKHTEIKYEGLINFPWSDRRCGEAEQYEVYSGSAPEEDKVYPIFAKIIDEAVAEPDFGEDFAVPAKVKEELEGGEDEDEYQEFIDFLAAYKDLLAQETVDSFVEAIRETEEEIDEELAEAGQQLGYK